MKAKKVYEFRTSGEIVSMGNNELYKKIIMQIATYNKTTPELIKGIWKFYKNIIIPDNLKVEYLKDLEIQGDLRIKDNPYIKVIDNVDVHIDLIIDNLPNLKILKSYTGRPQYYYSSIKITNCPNLIQLPDNIDTNRIYFYNLPNITKLPNNINVDNIELTKTNITYIPILNKNKKANNVELFENKIEKIEGNQEFVVLSITNEPINELPDDLLISDALGISKTGISELPKICKVFNGDVNLSYSNIENLNNVKRIEGFLKLNNTQNIRSLPKDLYIERFLDISNSNVEYIYEENVGGRIFMNHSAYKNKII